MKTKNFLLTGALLIVALFSVNGVMAEGPANTDNVTVNIKFTPIQTIEVNGDQNVVNFVYDNIETYQSGAEPVEYPRHLKINSSGPFVVNVGSTDFTGGLSGKTILASDVAVLVAESSGNPIDDYDFVSTELRLSNSPQPLITSPTKGGMNLEFDVTYSNPGGENGKYLEGYLKDEEVTYTADVTYEIIAI
jgi:hypothetical protein